MVHFARFITGLPLTSSGYDAILTVTDRLTRLVHLIPTTTKCDATMFASLVRDHIISKHGCPGDIVTDRGSIFTGKFWAAVCSALSIHLSRSTAFHPQSDGATETVNKMVEQVLRCHCMTAQEEWSDHLSMVEFALNNTQHSSLAKTPFFLNFGQHPLTPVALETIRLSKVPAALKWTQNMQQALQNAKAFLQAAKDRQKAYADAKRTEAHFAVGSQVLLSTINLTPKFGVKKLYPKWLGPFTVTHQVNDVAYKLKLPDSLKIHPVFHVSLLKPYSSDGKVQPPAGFLTEEGDLVWYVEKILLHRDKKSGKRVKKEYLVKWEGYGPEDTSWEPEDHFTTNAAIDEYWKATQLLEDLKASRKPVQVTGRKRARGA